jgi:hypothetical protein
MKNKLLIILATVWLMTSCSLLKKATPDNASTADQTESSTSDPMEAVITTLGEWQTLQTGGNISLKGSTNFSSSVQVRMVRDQAIFISLRPMLGIEVGKLLITADSIYAIDKLHKRYLAEKVSILTAGIPVTVSEVQDMFLGRPFIISKGTLSEDNKDEMTVTREGNKIVIAPKEQFKGYGYTFTFGKSNHITSLDIVPAGSTTAAYQVKYSDVRNTTAGNIAHGINAHASVNKKSMDFSLTYKDIDWNGKVKIDCNIPNGYSRMNAKDLFSIFSN